MLTGIENIWLIALIAGLTGYLSGTISFARIIMRVVKKSGKFQVNRREIPDTDIVLETNTVAATTVALDLGKKWGCLTAILDMIKVAIPIWFFREYFPEHPYFLITAIMGMLGHIYPVFFRFRGGRGQAPLLGALFVINWFGVLIANFAAVILGYLTGLVLVMRWGWMVVMIFWIGIWFKDPFYLAFIVSANFLFFFSMRKEIQTGIEILKHRKSTQEEVSDFMLMGKGFGRFIDNYGFPALLKKIIKSLKSN